jgi:hypothetical protein
LLQFRHGLKNPPGADHLRGILANDGFLVSECLDEILRGEWNTRGA